MTDPPDEHIPEKPEKLPARRVFEAWWPLAGSWVLMALELTAVSSFVARLPEPKVNLAAYGGIVFPLSLLIESPIIMLLSASNALSRDLASYRKLNRFMHVTGAVLTLLHFVIAFTPVYDLVASRILHSPVEIREAGRLGLRIMLPWTWTIAYRRFHQGVLIRFGRSRVISAGTVLRLCTNIVVLGWGTWRGDLAGIVVGALAVAAGVMVEAVYIGVRVQPVLRGPLREAKVVRPALTAQYFAAFYLPLVLTSLLALLEEPIGAAAMARMPHKLESLAAWPPLISLVFLIQSLGLAFNEVVVAMVGAAGAPKALRDFAWRLAAASLLFLVLLAATPLSRWWFDGMIGLRPDLGALARLGLWAALPLPLAAVANSWYQGVLLHRGRTRPISESVVLFLVTAASIAIAGVAWGRVTGLYVAMSALAVGTLMQTAWLRFRSAETRRELDQA